MTYVNWFIDVFFSHFMQYVQFLRFWGSVYVLITICDYVHLRLSVLQQQISASARLYVLGQVVSNDVG